MRKNHRLDDETRKKTQSDREKTKAPDNERSAAKAEAPDGYKKKKRSIKVVIGILAALLALMSAGAVVFGSMYYETRKESRKVTNEKKQLGKTITGLKDQLKSAQQTAKEANGAAAAAKQEAENAKKQAANATSDTTADKKKVPGAGSAAKKEAEPKDNYEAAGRNIDSGAAKTATGSTDTTANDGSRDTLKRTHDDENGASTDEVTYKNYIEGKQFSFVYPSGWDGKVIFKNETKDDGSVRITCYQSGQYALSQKGAQLNGEIFSVLINKDKNYKNEDNSQYKIAASGDYSAYYLEPAKVTYDYVGHPEYASDFQLVYENLGTMWRSFVFDE